MNAPMTKPDLMAELADKWDAMAADARKKGEHGMSSAYEDCAEELRTRHADLEAVVRDAARYRWLRHEGMSYYSTGIMPDLVWHGPDWLDIADSDGLDAAIDQAMHNSAREG